MALQENELREEIGTVNSSSSTPIAPLIIRTSKRTFWLVYVTYSLFCLWYINYTLGSMDYTSTFWWVTFFTILGYLLTKLPNSKYRAANLTLSAEGLEQDYQPSPTRRTVIPWSQLRLVGLFQTAWSNFLIKGPAQRRVILNFTGVPEYYIDLNRLSDYERQHFFRLLSRYAPQRLLSPEVLFMQVQSLYGERPSIESFTQIWAEEFDKRFELANHVSLSPGSMCGNDRYTVEMTIATRISSSTYLASDQNGTRVVLKELVIPINADDDIQKKLLEQFEREAGILVSLSHKAIVSIRDHFVENGRSYLVMDCVPGINLRHHVRQHGSLSQKQAVSIAQQLAEVLCYLHMQTPAIIHRDLTPDNIVYFENADLLKVVDFGAANIYQCHGTGTLIGKQGYMPPEQFKGKATPASDVYALGSTLVFLLSGTDPPGMGRMPETALQVDSKLGELVQACLQFDQEDRPSAATLVEQLKMISNRLKEEK